MGKPRTPTVNCDLYNFPIVLQKLAPIVAGIILGGFSIWGVGQLYESVRSYTWPHVNGTIIASVARSQLMRGGGREYMSYWPEVRYEYIVGDRRLTADRIRFIVRGMSQEETQRVVGSYPVGKPVTVYVDPRDSTAAVLEQGIWWPMIPILAFSMTVTWLAAAVTYSDFRKASRRP
jgi:hypothetical protein